MSLGLMGGGRNPTHTSTGRQGDVQARKTQVDPDTPGLSQASRYFSLFLALSFLSFFCVLTCIASLMPPLGPCDVSTGRLSPWSTWSVWGSVGVAIPLGGLPPCLFMNSWGCGEPSSWKRRQWRQPRFDSFP